MNNVESNKDQGNHHNESIQPEVGKEQKYRLIFENTPLGALHFNKDGTITDCNDAFVKIIGSSREALIGLNMLKLTDKKMVEAVKAALEGRNGFYKGIYQSVTANKSTPVSVHFAPYVNEVGDNSGGVGIVEDITEKELTLAAIAEKEAYFEKLFESSPEGIVILDVNDCVMRCNKTFCNMFGYTMQEITSKPVNSLIVPEHLKDEAEELTRIAAKETIIKRDTVRIKKDGSPVYVSILANPITFKGGQIAIYGIYRDISTQKSTEAALLKAKIKAEESDRLKTAFLNNLSHEVRTPMNAIMGFSHMLNEKNISEEQTRHITQIILKSSDKLLSVIDDIVKISTIESGTLEVSNNTFDINALLNDVCLEYAEQVKGKGIRFRYHSKLTDQESMVLSDESKVRQILSILVNNAIKYTSKGHVEVGCTIEETNLKFYVADTGCGIDQAHQAIIFKRFRQGKVNPDELQSGMGLGLPIAKGYVEVLGGNIWLDTSEYSGSLFFFTIPYKPVHQKPLKREANHYMMIEGQRTVLVVEDEEYNFSLTEEILSFQDIKVLHAWNGKEAVAMAKENDDISLVLMDIKMPVMGGFEATKLIKAFKPDLPIIALTAYALEGDRQLALHNGCDDYLSKPVSIKVLENMVSKYLV